MGNWTAGVLAAVVATVLATLILDSLSGDESTETVTETQPSDTQAVDDNTSSAPVATSEPAEIEEAPQLLITTYVWEDDDGWIEHASWVSDTVEENFVPVLSAWNWTPDYPAVTVRFDDFETLNVADNFDQAPLSSVWTSQPTSGATADIEDGELVVRIAEGLTEALHEKRVDLFHAGTVADDFDISVRFDVGDDFYSVATGGLSLSIVGTQEFQALMILQGDSYQSQEFSGSTFRTLAATTGQQQTGGLRMRAVTIEN